MRTEIQMFSICGESQMLSKLSALKYTFLNLCVLRTGERKSEGKENIHQSPITDAAHLLYPSAVEKYCCRICKHVVASATKEITKATSPKMFWDKLSKLVMSRGCGKSSSQLSGQRMGYCAAEVASIGSKVCSSAAHHTSPSSGCINMERVIGVGVPTRRFSRLWHSQISAATAKAPLLPPGACRH